MVNPIVSMTASIDISLTCETVATLIDFFSAHTISMDYTTSDKTIDLTPIESDYIETAKYCGLKVFNMAEPNKPPSNKGRKLSKEHCEAISRAKKKLWLNPDYRNQMSLRVKGLRNPMFAKEVSNETRDKLSIKAKEMWANANIRSILVASRSGEGNGMYGKRHSKDSIEKMKATKALHSNKGKLYGHLLSHS